MPKKAKDKMIEILKNTLIPKDTSNSVVKKSTTKKSVSKNRIAKVSEKKEESKKKSSSKKSATNKKLVADAPVKKTKKKSASKKAEEEVSPKTATKKIVKKKTSSKKVDTKKTNTQKVSEKKAASKKPLKEVGSTNKVVEKKTSSKKSTKKANSTKKNVSKKNSSTKSKTLDKKTSKTNTKKQKGSSLNLLGEYYDLPNHYEQTLVKILAQTPNILFVYWDISSQDRQNLIANYGENFFQETCPYLQVKNQTKNYQFEVEINDYANSWYLHIPDSDCKYEVVLMRKNKNSQVILENSGHLTITSSNQLETPNDHILFEKLGKTIFFQDTKTHQVHGKDITSFSFIHNIGRIYNIYDLYKEIYQNELNGDELGTNLSSSNFSSSFK